MRNHIIASSIAGVLAVSSALHAEVVIGNNTSTDPTIWEIDDNGVRAPIPLAVGYTVSGMAYDPNARVLYWTDGSQSLYRANYTPGQQTTIDPESVGVLHTLLTSIEIDGLGFNSATNSLYGFRAEGATIGFYRLSTGNALCTVANILPDTEFAGMDYNPADGHFYGVNNDPPSASLPDGAGLYRIDGIGGGVLSASLIASLPQGMNHVDGLSAGPDTLYLINGNGSADIVPYSLTTDTYNSPISSPLLGNDATLGGAAYATPIPEPATLAGAAGIGLLGLRRRSKSRRFD